MKYIELKSEELSTEPFKSFVRHQEVNQCWRKVNGEWVIKDIHFIDEWNEYEYLLLVDCLKNTVNTGGFVMGAFNNGILKGFTSVEAKKFGANLEYLDLTSIHSSEDIRGRGIGKELFKRAVAWAKGKGAKKLYISAHPAVETQAFYKAMSCVEALEYNEEHVENEPYDCQLEYVL